MSSEANLSKQNSCSWRRTGCTRSYSLPRKLEFSSPIRYLKFLAGKLTAAVISRPKSQHQAKEVTKPTNVTPTMDSQRAEAIHDCIDFINSSSSFTRSNSIPAR